jgi:hypothetical protein
MKGYRDDVKKALQRYGELKKICDSLQRKAEVLDDQIRTVHSRQITDMPRGGAAVTIEDLIAEKDDLERRIWKFSMYADEEKKTVQGYIDTVISEKHNELLTMHFIRLMSVSEIAIRKHYSERHAWRIYKEALGMVRM